MMAEGPRFGYVHGRCGIRLEQAFRSAPGHWPRMADGRAQACIDKTEPLGQRELKHANMGICCMRLTIRKIQHYGRLFEEAVHNFGWSYALLRTSVFLRQRVRLRLFRLLGAESHRFNTPTISPFADIVEKLGTAITPRPLLLIVSNTQIRQCIHYRIHQKIRYLDQIGLKALYVSPIDAERLRAFLPLTHTVIVYRTALDAKWLAAFRKSGVKILFEFDDLVVGKSAMEASGILDQVTVTQASGLLNEAEALQTTAAACDGLIVSTPYLAELYGRPENGLADKPAMVVPNFIETDDFLPPSAKQVTFAFTSPSGSIQSEMAMLIDFLHGYDTATNHDWSILVIGNLTAQRRLSEEEFQHGTVMARPFSDFDSYLASIATAEAVLIPLSDSSFNRAKTPIRLMDAAVAGTQAVFCPVGAYESIRDALYEPSLCVASDSWAEAGGRIAPQLARVVKTTADLQQAVRQVYGVTAAQACYRAVFLDRLGLGDHVMTNEDHASRCGADGPREALV